MIWRPRHGSLVKHRAMTASLIDSREFLMTLPPRFLQLCVRSEGFGFGRMGASGSGANPVAERSASSRRRWKVLAKAAPFRRDDAMPIGVIVLPGTGIQDNLADKALKLGVWRCGG
jgi:hypothetical protein